MGLGYSNTPVNHQTSLSGHGPVIGEDIVRLMPTDTRVVGGLADLRGAGLTGYRRGGARGWRQGPDGQHQGRALPVPILLLTHLRQTRPQKRRLSRLGPPQNSYLRRFTGVTAAPSPASLRSAPSPAVRERG